MVCGRGDSYPPVEMYQPGLGAQEFPIHQVSCCDASLTDFTPLRVRIPYTPAMRLNFPIMGRLLMLIPMPRVISA